MDDVSLLSSSEQKMNIRLVEVVSDKPVKTQPDC